MADNPYVNKVVYGNDVLIDLSNDTVAANTLKRGATAHSMSGEQITGELDVLPSGGSDGDVLVKNGTADRATKWTNTPPQMGSLATIETSPTSQAHAQFENIVYNGKLYQVVIAVGANESLVPGTNIVERKALSEVLTFASKSVEITPGTITTLIPSTSLPKGRYLMIAYVEPNKTAKTMFQCRFYTDTGSYIKNDPTMYSSVTVQSIALATSDFTLATFINNVQFDGTTPYATVTNVTGRVIAIKL